MARIALLLIAAGLLAACNGIPSPYLKAGDKPTPADRTGGAQVAEGSGARQAR